MNARLIAAVGVVFVAITTPLTSRAITLQVNCDQPQGKLPTIGAALKIVTALGNLGPNTIEVTGTCRENISLTGVSNLTLTAKDGASITDASGGTAPVINIERSQNCALNGFAIRGGGGQLRTAIGCFWSSSCFLSRNNVQILGGTAIVTAFTSALSLNNDVLEQSQGGLAVLDDS